MNLLQTTHTVYTDWTWVYLPLFLYGLFYLLIAFIVIWLAVRIATKGQRQQMKITNALLMEQLRSHGISEEKILDVLKNNQ
jgi:hypothetical protein